MIAWALCKIWGVHHLLLYHPYGNTFFIGGQFVIIVYTSYFPLWPGSSPGLYHLVAYLDTKLYSTLPLFT